MSDKNGDARALIDDMTVKEDQTLPWTETATSRFLRKVDRLLSGNLIKVSPTKQSPGSPPPMGAGPDIVKRYLRGYPLGYSTSRGVYVGFKKLWYLTGCNPELYVILMKAINYHELAHIRYTVLDIKDDVLPYAREHGLPEGAFKQTVNWVEDQRIETIFTKVFPRSIEYFMILALFFIKHYNWEWEMTYGRKYLPKKLRMLHMGQQGQGNDPWQDHKNRHADEITSLIDQYTTATDKDTMLETAHELHKLMPDTPSSHSHPSSIRGQTNKGDRQDAEDAARKVQRQIQEEDEDIDKALKKMQEDEEETEDEEGEEPGGGEESRESEEDTETTESGETEESTETMESDDEESGGGETTETTESDEQPDDDTEDNEESDEDLETNIEGEIEDTFLDDEEPEDEGHRKESDEEPDEYEGGESEDIDGDVTEGEDIDSEEPEDEDIKSGDLDEDSDEDREPEPEEGGGAGSDGASDGGTGTAKEDNDDEEAYSDDSDRQGTDDSEEPEEVNDDEDSDEDIDWGDFDDEIEKEYDDTREDLAGDINDDMETIKKKETVQISSDKKRTGKKVGDTLKKIREQLKAGYARNERSGRIDLRKAMKSEKTGDTRVFKKWRPSQEEATKLGVAIHIDISGSMMVYNDTGSSPMYINRGETTEHLPGGSIVIRRNKSKEDDGRPLMIDVAFDQADMIAHGLESSDCLVKVYGYGDVPRQYLLKDIHDKNISRVDGGSMGTEPHPVLEAARENFKEMRRSHGVETFLNIVITDGEWHDIGKSREALQAMENDGVYTVELGIGPEPTNNGSMFFQRVSGPEELLKYVKKIVREISVDIKKKHRPGA